MKNILNIKTYLFNVPGYRTNYLMSMVILEDTVHLNKNYDIAYLIVSHERQLVERVLQRLRGRHTRRHRLDISDGGENAGTVTAGTALTEAANSPLLLVLVNSCILSLLLCLKLEQVLSVQVVTQQLLFAVQKTRQLLFAV